MKLPALLATIALLCATLPAPAQQTGSKVLLLGSESVRNELGLSNAQRRSLDSLRNAFRNEARELVSAGDAGSASRLQRVIAAYDQRALAVLTADQTQTLRQIKHRILGAWMLHEPEVQKELGLSDNQIARVAEIQDRMTAKNADINRLFDAGKITPAQRLAKLRDARLALTRSLERVLNRQQRAQLRALAG